MAQAADNVLVEAMTAEEQEALEAEHVAAAARTGAVARPRLTGHHGKGAVHL